MPDLLTHALVAYSLATLLSRRFRWLSPAYVTVAMAGAFVPDLAKAALVVPDASVELAVGYPFDWFGIHTLGGAVVSVAVGVVLVATPERRRVAGLLALGAASHLLADAFLSNPSGRSYPLLWPLSFVHPPTPGLYLSTDPAPTAAAALLAALTFWATRGSSRKNRPSD